jgi:predicted RNase H-like nuclease
MSSWVAGVDWAKEAWFGILVQDGEYRGYVVEKKIADLWKSIEHTDLALIDVPIGLPDSDGHLEQREDLDKQARQITGRPSSIFPVPTREACEAAADGNPYAEVLEINRSIVGKGISRQSYNIAAQIYDVDVFLRRNPDLHDRVVESHPEVCFQGLFGQQLSRRKLSAAGVSERLQALDTVFDAPEALLSDVCQELESEDIDVSVDDVIDTLGLAATAAFPTDERRTLRPNGGGEVPVTDGEGLPMQMIYWTDSSNLR